MEAEKRIVKTYRVSEGDYKKSKKKAHKEGKSLAVLIENFVVSYHSETEKTKQNG